MLLEIRQARDRAQTPRQATLCLLACRTQSDAWRGFGANTALIGFPPKEQVLRIRL